ncbi:MAG: phosphotransferase [Alphaproteobacteria bacterium]|nr:phosphotransferase [Alphaproteobacteria bacterium]MBU1280858.1 phosphotransferase [Alphaproteobacteria bacterium]MBU1572469.1 phosphotransferase [Alphaproteobacteria bacterium]MBU1829953.1 phosphotransferase [Alphaproteobacteria bacterium]MBU2076933.1 phosphotransferase [Alphaproteobacteria bacterium]
MSERAQLFQEFLGSGPWANSSVAALAGDASRRRYHRLKDRSTGRCAIAMDAPPEAGEDVRPFLKVATYLRDLGLSAPEIYAADETNGFLILEDFGIDLYDVVCAQKPHLETELYDAAVDVLIHIASSTPLEGAADYGPLMTDLALSCYRWYAEPVLGHDMSSECEAARTVLTPLIAALGHGRVTILRDYHAQNLLWLPDRTGPSRVGLLDFQDAMLGHPAYDVISLTTDARRDVPVEVQKRCLAQFSDGLNLNPVDFNREASICSVQRNLRILMIFARMSLHFARPHYVDLIPRVWAHLQRDLDHPDLADLARLIRADLPEPTKETLQCLKEKCGTIPTLQ